MSAQDEFPPGWEYTTPSSEAIAWNTALTDTRCESCGAVNSQVSEDEDEEEE